MTPDLRDLAAAVVALPGWEWRPGMLDSATGLRIVKVLPDGSVCLLRVAPVNLTPRLLIRTRDDIRLMEMRPDLTDPATAGAMLGILMVGGGIGVALVSNDGDGRWYAGSGPIWHSSPAGSGATPGEAIARMVVARGGWR